MSRKPTAALGIELPADRPSVRAAATVVDQVLDASPRASGWFAIAVTAYREWHREASAGIETAGARAELEVVYHATLACALQLWANERIQKRFLNPANVQKVLTTMVSAAAGAPPVLWPDLRVAWSRPGRAPGAPALGARGWDPDKLREEFPGALERVRAHVQRKHFRRPRWLDLLASEFNMSPATLRRALDAQPALRQLLRETTELRN